MFNFLYPLYFLLLIPLYFLVFFLYKKGTKKTLFGPINDLKVIFKNNTLYVKLYYFLMGLIFLFFVFLFSKPVISSVFEEQSKDGIDIQIVLDVSFSMSAKDLSPNRLDVAKEVISGFLDEINSDRVGIIIFAGKTFTSLPLSFDYQIVKEIVSDISVNTIDQMYGNMQGTAVGDALILASDSFGEQNKREKVIVLLTDGEANKGIAPLSALKYIKESNKNIKIYTVGIGGDNDTYVTVTDNFGRKMDLPISGVDEDTLKIISNETGGKYFRANSKAAFKKIFEEISKLEKSELKLEVVKVNKEKNIYFVYVLLFLFLLFLFIKNKKRIF